MNIVQKNTAILINIFLIYYSHTGNNVKGQDLLNDMDIMHETAAKLLESFKEQLEALREYGKTDSSGLIKDQNYPSSCLTSFFNASGIYTIQVPGLNPFPVYCDNCRAGFGWLVIQRRFNGSLSFFRNWEEYKKGFGDLQGEYFIGLEKLRAITAVEPFELYIILEDFDNETRYAKFDEFAIGNEEDDYALNVLGSYTGTAGDSLRSHRKMKFSTYDRDNDQEFARNCAFLHVGAWWYNQCVDSNLNGQYINGGKYEEKLFARGMCWRAWRGHNYGYKFTQMMIRPKCRNFPASFDTKNTNNNKNSSQPKCDSFS